MPEVLKVKSPLLKDHIQFVAINGFVPDKGNIIPVMPDGVSALVINVGKPYQRSCSLTGEMSTVKGSHFVGIKSRACYVKPNFEMRTVSIRFKPGAIKFFLQNDASELTDQVVEASLLFGSDIFFLEDKIAGESDPNQILRLVELFLLKKMIRRPGLVNISGKIELIYSRPTELRTRDLLGGSRGYKSLEREFIRHLGISPKTFIDIARFNYSSSLLFREPEAVLTQIGLQAGYYDQSHFTHSFKKFSGFTPSQFQTLGSEMFLDNQRIISEFFNFSKFRRTERN
ncbi:MAG: AraC family transcriptional regulator [Bacteroidia bacterium]|nr:AraC family transcriptional regulator [Bacteroidia bacterium]